MKSKLLIVTLCVAGPLFGCVAVSPSASYCDIASTLYFERMSTVDWLADNDAVLLRGIVVHNEQRAALCN